MKIRPNDNSEVTNGDYFEMLRKKTNFLLPDYGSSIVYLKSYNQYSIFLIFSDKSFTMDVYKQEKNSKTDLFLYRDIILFDHKKNICYLIKYGGTWGGMMLTYQYVDKNKVIRIKDQFTSGINSIVRLDEHFGVLYGTILETYQIGGLKRQDNEFIGLFEFKRCDNTVYKRLLYTPAISINEITDIEFAQFFSDEHGYTIYIEKEWEIQDINKIFEIGGMF